jgi:hypothetical protein
MSGTEIILWLALIALLACYVRIKRGQMLRTRWEPCDPAKWTGKGIDVSRVMPKVEDLRRDYLAGRQPIKGVSFHRALVELARKAVVGLAYFQEKEPQQLNLSPSAGTGHGSSAE